MAAGPALTRVVARQAGQLMQAPVELNLPPTADVAALVLALCNVSGLNPMATVVRSLTDGWLFDYDAPIGPGPLELELYNYRAAYMPDERSAIIVFLDFGPALKRLEGTQRRLDHMKVPQSFVCCLAETAGHLARILTGTKWLNRGVDSGAKKIVTTQIEFSVGGIQLNLDNDLLAFYAGSTILVDVDLARPLRSVRWFFGPRSERLGWQFRRHNDTDGSGPELFPPALIAQDKAGTAISITTAPMSMVRPLDPLFELTPGHHRVLAAYNSMALLPGRAWAQVPVLILSLIEQTVRTLRAEFAPWLTSPEQAYDPTIPASHRVLGGLMILVQDPACATLPYSAVVLLEGLANAFVAAVSERLASERAQLF